MPFHRCAWSRAIRCALVVYALAGALPGCSSDEPAKGPGGPAATVPWGIVIHGGAGVIKRDELTPEREAEIRATLENALRAGHAVLEAGGTSLDAVTAAIVILEDSPHFNAGKGAVFTHDGTNELDSSIMNGATTQAGAVAGVAHVKNPILLARRVMEASPHVMMTGPGAEEFARTQGIELVPADYFRTEQRWNDLQRILQEEAGPRGGDDAPRTPAPAPPPVQPDSSERPPSTQPPTDPKFGHKLGHKLGRKFGTVGAVALDRSGNLAAGTSTGGMTNKRYGRVGDSPIIGAGTYAGSRCAVSATGHGEFFIRYTVARDICARMEYLGIPLHEAAHAVIHGVLVKAGGSGGIIALDNTGNVVMSFNSPGMYRGTMGADGAPTVAIFK